MSKAVDLKATLASQAPEELTSREAEIVTMISQGFSSKEVGRRLSVAEGTVKAHLHNIYARLQIQNRTALSVWYFRRTND